MNEGEKQKFLLHLEVDTEGASLADQSAPLVDDSDLLVEIVEDQETSHGFGLAEIVTISIAVGSGVASQLIAESIKSSVKAIIRRVSGRNGEGDGTSTGLTAVIEAERQSQNNGNQENT
ncbi:hypothetical protein [Streptomyces griseus]|uniref:hypothetical protein n=1 Tax=Streptomyces griseus TaxID=1911 RepID=UPI00131B48B5|nr:hypothetical protein [Streptomyces griseus]